MKYYQILLLAFVWSNSFGQLETLYFKNKFQFKTGETASLFADNVKLRSAPSTASEVLDILKIDTTIEILKRTDSMMIFDGIDSYWYNVSVAEKTGYILGALISIQDFEFGGVKLKTQLKSAKQEVNNMYPFLKLRVLKDTSYVAYEFPLIGHEFSLKLKGSQGLSNLDNILLINYFAEACGVEGGTTYLFWNNDTFYHVADLSSWSDSGMYSFNERFIFSNHPKSTNKITYKIETTTTEDEDSNWVKETTQTRDVIWDGEKLNLELRSGMKNKEEQ